ncbi:MAG: translocation/assembly module TamB domain-containing protein [Treponema sp.]|nr:translocation/assembly module TamB domain-containing protein [Treponema sp.]
MSKKRAVRRAYIFVFLIILLVSFLCIRPIYNKLTQAISWQVESLRTVLQEETGLAVSYSSLSPSILTVFNIKGIALDSAKSGKNIVEIRKIVFRYSLFGLLSGDRDDALKSLTIDGITIDYNDVTDRSIIEKIVALARAQNGNAAGKVRAINYSDALVNLPFDVIIKNVRMKCSGAAGTVSCTVRSARAAYDDVAHVLNVNSESTVDAALKNGTTVSGKCAVNGAIHSGLEGSFLVARFSNVSCAGFSFSPINFLISYADSTVSARTMQLSFPLMLSASYNFDERIANASFTAERLALSSCMSSRKYASLLQKMGGTTVTAHASASYDVLEKKAAYDGDCRTFMQDSFVPGSLAAHFSFSGDETSITIPSLVFSGERYDADAAFTYEFAHMRLLGTADARRIALPNGNVISTELFFDPLDRGFVCFSPQVFFGEKALTALQLTVMPENDSIDYRFEISDYAHLETEMPGMVQIDGSYLTKTNYIQAGVSVTNEFLDSIAELASFFLSSSDASVVEKLLPTLHPYMFTGEAYVSSDFKSISFNAPYALVANTHQDNQFLLLSFDGNESSLQLTQFDVIHKSQTVHASAEFDRAPDSASSFFVLDVSYGGVPYHFTGNLMPNYIMVSGDYGIVAQAQRFTDGSVEGSLVMERLPVSVGNAILVFSSETGFAYTPDEGGAVHIMRFEAEDASGALNFSPRLILSGTVTQYGAIFDTISYSDMFSALGGNAQCIVNVNDNIFDSAHFEFALENQLSDEFITIVADVTNPDSMPLSIDMLKRNMYFDAQFGINNFNLNRFISEQSENNVLTASVTATGTYENPYVSLSIDEADMMIAGGQLALAGSTTLEGRDFRIDIMNVDYGSLDVNDISATFSLETFTGKADATLNISTAQKSLTLPLSLEVADTVVENGTPLSFAATLASPGVSGNLITKSFPFSLTLLRTYGGMIISSSENLGISGVVDDEGNINVAIDESKPVHCNVAGAIKGRNLDIHIFDVSADIAELVSHIENEYVAVYRGVMTGSARIGGLLSDPEFSGGFAITNADFSIPLAIPSHITKDAFNVTLEHNEIRVPEVMMNVRNKPVYVSLVIVFDRWAFDRVEVFVRTPENQTAPADVDVTFARFTGNASVDLAIVYHIEKILDVTGSIYADNVKAIFMINELSTIGEGATFDSRVDLDISVGTRANFILNPFLRCVIVPGSSMKFQMDQTVGTFSVSGDIAVRSGDISYLNRSFYIKEGSLKFNDTDTSFNPRLTARAETRERDTDGREVRLILSADNQPLFDFVPQISSIPAKSEVELQAMLGQLTAGGSGNVSDLIVTSTDFVLQSLVVRRMEDKLRDWLNFDIFSIRPTVLQNMLRFGFGGDYTTSEMRIGNFFDNSTVYIGKYFGSAVYVDALMHVAYDGTRIDDKTTVQGITFQPELGFEFETPFVNIRWSTAPDITAMLNNVITPSTSLTLSWRFSF